MLFPFPLTWLPVLDCCVFLVLSLSRRWCFSHREASLGWGNHVFLADAGHVIRHWKALKCGHCAEREAEPVWAGIQISPLANISGTWALLCRWECVLRAAQEPSSLLIRLYCEGFSFISVKSHCRMSSPLLCHQQHSTTSVFFRARVTCGTILELLHRGIWMGLFYSFS